MCQVNPNKASKEKTKLMLPNNKNNAFPNNKNNA
jgi:hypothetical protein